MTIALSIAMTWAALTACGFLALSALGRRERRDDLEADRAAHEPEGIALADMWAVIPGVSPL
jgi:hypothetical protein